MPADSRCAKKKKTEIGFETAGGKLWKSAGEKLLGGWTRFLNFIGDVSGYSSNSSLHFLFHMFVLELRTFGAISFCRLSAEVPPKKKKTKCLPSFRFPGFGGHWVFYDVWKKWADPGVLWKKAPKAMRAMRGKTLETVPFQPYFGCTESFLKVLSN